MAKFGVYLGRFSPMHLGHEAVIDAMLEKYGDDCIILIGSSTEAQSMRHFFPYSDRRYLINEIYPGMKVMGLPDHHDIGEWFSMLTDVLCCLTDFELTKVEFFAGCKEDVIWFEEAGYKISYLDRFDGTTPVVSATQVRTNLLQGKPLDGLVNPMLSDLIINRFNELWEQFKNK